MNAKPLKREKNLTKKIFTNEITSRIMKTIPLLNPGLNAG